MMKLFHAWGSCSLASLIALEEAGADYELVIMSTKTGDQRRPEYLAVNPKGRVPALITPQSVPAARHASIPNVICEAARIGTPVIASRMSGNLGMLGRDYPAYYPVADHAALARLLAQAKHDAAFYRRLQKALRARRALFAPAAERRALLGVVRELLP